jgi:DNA-binding LytR/AlgR family response regulator
VSASRSDGRATLVLQSGVKAPVSRSFYKSLQQAGWFSR